MHGVTLDLDQAPITYSALSLDSAQTAPNSPEDSQFDSA